LFSYKVPLKSNAANNFLNRARKQVIIGRIPR
jgi:hypothetical protein